MNTISNTAWYCCGIRMEDAARKKPVCNDHYAKRFMDENGMKIFEPFKTLTMPNIWNVTRCRIIDDLLGNEIEKNNNINIITIGAGFDTRPYRLPGGVWAEIDEPQIIHYKNERLPVAECKNPLQRISINFASESLKEKLATLQIDQPPVIVIEGVSMYLTQDAIQTTINVLQELYPEHILICDLMNKIYFDKFASKIHEKLVAVGGRITERPDKPDELFLNSNYIKIENIPISELVIESGVLWNQLKIPSPLFRLIMNLFMKDLYGYSISRFQYG